MPLRHLDGGHVVAVCVLDVGLEDLRTVDEDCAVAHLYGVARQPYDALHEVAPRVDRIFEDGYIAALGAVVRKVVPEI